MDHPMAHGIVLSPHEQLLDKAAQAIRGIFADTSVDKRQTDRDFQALGELIEVMRDSLFS